jgi:hypothetical protein
MRRVKLKSVQAVLFMVVLPAVFPGCTSQRDDDGRSGLPDSDSASVAHHARNQAEIDSASKIVERILSEQAVREHEYRGGAAIGQIGGQEYAISYVAQGDKHMVLLQRLVDRKESGEANYAILDVLILSPPSDSEELVFGFCGKDGLFDQEIIALVVYEDKEYFRKIVRAWRADRRQEKISEVSPQQIICKNEGWGV